MKHKTFRLGILLSLLLALLTAQPASAVAGVWNPTGSMGTPRWYHSATLLPNGKVLVAGGENNGVLASAELYDPPTGTWTATGSLAVARQAHTATLLPNGKVLVTGGLGAFSILARAELYNPATGLWTNTSSMGTRRWFQSATLLADGKVLVAGGQGVTGALLASAELYNPATNNWSPTGSLHAARMGHTAVRLLSGKVLVIGGMDPQALASAELYDPATGQWTTTGAMATERSTHTATLLSNGKVLVVGGRDASYTALTSAELYDPAAQTWSATGSLAAGRWEHAAASLRDGKVLVSGGNDTQLGRLSSAEIYDPASGAWTPTSSLATGRFVHSTLLLPNGKVLAVGGDGAAARLASAELYTSTQVLRPKSDGPQDGWVLESSETSNQGGAVNATALTFNLGDTADRQQYRAILGFNTGALPDNAVVTGVVLKIKKQGLAGTNPFTTHGKIAIDICRGAFSNVAALQPTDFQAAASKPGAGVIANNPAAGGWYAARLSAAAYPFVNRTGVTQLRLRFQLDDDNDAVADFLRFYSGNAAAANRPVLVVEYYVR